MSELPRWPRYRPLRIIGHGGFGTVYLCEDTKADSATYQQHVAVKAVSLNTLSDEEVLMMLSEVSLLKNIDHPNIIKYYDSFLYEEAEEEGEAEEATERAARNMSSSGVRSISSLLTRRQHSQQSRQVSPSSCSIKSQWLCLVTEYMDGGDLSSLLRQYTHPHDSENSIRDDDGVKKTRNDSKERGTGIASLSESQLGDSSGKAPPHSTPSLLQETPFSEDIFMMDTEDDISVHGAGAVGAARTSQHPLRPNSRRSITASHVQSDGASTTAASSSSALLSHVTYMSGQPRKRFRSTGDSPTAETATRAAEKAAATATGATPQGPVISLNKSSSTHEESAAGTAEGPRDGEVEDGWAQRSALHRQRLATTLRSAFHPLSTAADASASAQKRTKKNMSLQSTMGAVNTWVSDASDAAMPQTPLGATDAARQRVHSSAEETWKDTMPSTTGPRTRASVTADADAHAEAATDPPRQLWVESFLITDIAKQCLDAIAYLHALSIVHRDIKPSNIYLSKKDGTVKIGDFGVSKLLQPNAPFATTFVGTPFYLCPELCMGDPYSFGADVWALGVVLYELYCLQLPFTADNVLAQIYVITEGTYNTKALRTPHAFCSAQHAVLENLYGSAFAQSEQLLHGLVVDMVEGMLQVDPQARPSAEALLSSVFSADAGAATFSVSRLGSSAGTSTASSPSRRPPSAGVLAASSSITAAAAAGRLSTRDGAVGKDRLGPQAADRYTQGATKEAADASLPQALRLLWGPPPHQATDGWTHDLPAQRVNAGGEDTEEQPLSVKVQLGMTDLLRDMPLRQRERLESCAEEAEAQEAREAQRRSDSRGPTTAVSTSATKKASDAEELTPHLFSYESSLRYDQLQLSVAAPSTTTADLLYGGYAEKSGTNDVPATTISSPLDADVDTLNQSIDASTRGLLSDLMEEVPWLQSAEVFSAIPLSAGCDDVMLVACASMHKDPWSQAEEGSRYVNSLRASEKSVSPSLQIGFGDRGGNAPGRRTSVPSRPTSRRNDDASVVASMPLVYYAGAVSRTNANIKVVPVRNENSTGAHDANAIVSTDTVRKTPPSPSTDQQQQQYRVSGGSHVVSAGEGGTEAPITKKERSNVPLSSSASPTSSPTSSHAAIAATPTAAAAASAPRRQRVSVTLADSNSAVHPSTPTRLLNGERRTKEPVSEKEEEQPAVVTVVTKQGGGSCTALDARALSTASSAVGGVGGRSTDTQPRSGFRTSSSAAATPAAAAQARPPGVRRNEEWKASGAKVSQQTPSTRPTKGGSAISLPPSSNSIAAEAAPTPKARSPGHLTGYSTSELEELLQAKLLAHHRKRQLEIKRQRAQWAAQAAEREKTRGAMQAVYTAAYEARRQATAFDTTAPTEATAEGVANAPQPTTGVRVSGSPNTAPLALARAATMPPVSGTSQSSLSFPTSSAIHAFVTTPPSSSASARSPVEGSVVRASPDEAAQLAKAEETTPQALSACRTAGHRDVVEAVVTRKTSEAPSRESAREVLPGKPVASAEEEAVAPTVEDPYGVNALLAETPAVRQLRQAAVLAVAVERQKEALRNSPNKPKRLHVAPRWRPPYESKDVPGLWETSSAEGESEEEARGRLGRPAPVRVREEQRWRWSAPPSDCESASSSGGRASNSGSESERVSSSSIRSGTGSRSSSIHSSSGSIHSSSGSIHSSSGSRSRSISSSGSVHSSSRTSSSYSSTSARSSTATPSRPVSRSTSRPSTSTVTPVLPKSDTEPEVLRRHHAGRWRGKARIQHHDSHSDAKSERKREERERMGGAGPTKTHRRRGMPMPSQKATAAEEEAQQVEETRKSSLLGSLVLPRLENTTGAAEVVRSELSYHDREVSNPRLSPSAAGGSRSLSPRIAGVGDHSLSSSIHSSTGSPDRRRRRNVLETKVEETSSPSPAVAAADAVRDSARRDRGRRATSTVPAIHSDHSTPTTISRTSSESSSRSGTNSHSSARTGSSRSSRNRSSSDEHDGTEREGEDEADEDMSYTYAVQIDADTGRRFFDYVCPITVELDGVLPTGCRVVSTEEALRMIFPNAETKAVPALSAGAVRSKDTHGTATPTVPAQSPVPQAEALNDYFPRRDSESPPPAEALASMTGIPMKAKPNGAAALPPRHPDVASLEEAKKPAAGSRVRVSATKARTSDDGSLGDSGVSLDSDEYSLLWPEGVPPAWIDGQETKDGDDGSAAKQRQKGKNQGGEAETKKRKTPPVPPPYTARDAANRTPAAGAGASNTEGSTADASAHREKSPFVVGTRAVSLSPFLRSSPSPFTALYTGNNSDLRSAVTSLPLPQTQRRSRPETVRFAFTGQEPTSAAAAVGAQGIFEDSAPNESPSIPSSELPPRLRRSAREGNGRASPRLSRSGTLIGYDTVPLPAETSYQIAVPRTLADSLSNNMSASTASREAPASLLAKPQFIRLPLSLALRPVRARTRLVGLLWRLWKATQLADPALRRVVLGGNCCRGTDGGTCSFSEAFGGWVRLQADRGRQSPELLRMPAKAADAAEGTPDMVTMPRAGSDRPRGPTRSASPIAYIQAVRAARRHAGGTPGIPDNADGEMAVPPSPRSSAEGGPMLVVPRWTLYFVDARAHAAVALRTDADWALVRRRVSEMGPFLPFLRLHLLLHDAEPAQVEP